MTAAELAQLWQAPLAEAGVVFLRIGAVIALLPGLGDLRVPARVRLGLALALTALLVPLLAGEAPAAGPRLFLTEPVIGLMIGLFLRLLFIALDLASAIMAQAISLAQLFPAAVPDPLPANGQILYAAALALLMQTGVTERLVELLLLSYRLLPPGQLPAAGESLGWAVAQVARATALGFSLAAPFLVTGMVLNLALGLMNRAMPQLMVMLIGAPALAGVALLLLALAAPLVLQVWQAALAGALADPFGLPK
ncbi:flagellar biosynthetic protein FliR [Frigidibacter sp. MR17.14]|uniref:flagellar biosynthetic protein FliR n=1 Tax=Frigidibacter sp. MR17.14 TaxID=3126509 RepID=UPI0030129E86